jgi:hypothetical protein
VVIGVPAWIMSLSHVLLRAQQWNGVSTTADRITSLPHPGLLIQDKILIMDDNVHKTK